MNRPKTLIIGGSGQLGLSLREFIPTALFPSQEHLSLNSTETIIKDYLTKNAIGLVINCAAYTNVEMAEVNIDECFNVNAVRVKLLAEICQQLNIFLVHISTDFVFDGNQHLPYLESNPVNPLSVYAKSKALGEQYIQESNVQFLIIRTSWLYSPHRTNFVKTMIKLMQSKESINVVNDQIGSPTSAVSLAYFIDQLVNSPQLPKGILHFCNTGEISWFEFALEIKNQLIENGLEIKCKIHPIKSSDYPSKVLRPKYSVLNTNLAQSLVSFKLADWKTELKNNFKKILEQLN